MPLNALLTALRQQQKNLCFAEVLATIKAHYYYAPTAFKNGSLHNAAADIGGSCFIFAFATFHSLRQDQTLICFGEHYQQVLASPSATSHPNLRQFMRTSLAALSFTHFPLRTSS